VAKATKACLLHLKLHKLNLFNKLPKLVLFSKLPKLVHTKATEASPKVGGGLGERAQVDDHQDHPTTTRPPRGSKMNKGISSFLSSRL